MAVESSLTGPVLVAVAVVFIVTDLDGLDAFEGTLDKPFEAGDCAALEGGTADRKEATDP